MSSSNCSALPDVAPLSIATDDDMLLPYDLIIENGMICAGSLEFHTMVNVALTCRAVRDGLKGTLDRKVMVWTVPIEESAFDQALLRKPTDQPLGWKQVK